MDLWATVAGGVSGLITGTIGSLVAPWANWQVEKRREKLRAKRERVAEWRKELGEAQGYLSAEVYDNVRETRCFAQLEPFMTREETAVIEGSGEDEDGGVDGVGILLAVVDRVEKEWGLI
jgi:hypothetical protein